MSNYIYFSVVKIYTKDWLSQQYTPKNDYLVVYKGIDRQWVEDRAMDDERAYEASLVAITRMDIHEFAQHSDLHFSRFWRIGETYNSFMQKTTLVDGRDSVWRKELNTLPVKYVNNN